jgi:two-component sensor histidine kinase
MSLAERFARLPTGAKLLLILTAVLLPIGIALAWIGETGIRQADAALEGRTEDQARLAARSIESLVARNALALRIAANGRITGQPGDSCALIQKSLAIAPAVAQNFELETPEGKPVCSAGEIPATGELPIIAPGDIRVRVAPDSRSLAIRAGVIGGMATTAIPLADVRSAVAVSDGAIRWVVLHDATRQVTILGDPTSNEPLAVTEWPIGHGNIFVRVATRHEKIRTIDRLLLLLPLLMWVAAAMITWSLVGRLLIRPLKLLEHSVIAYRPGEGPLELPRKLGPSEEIRELRNAFARTIAKIEESERETVGALEGQRRLVREVHHRVKNNLQVIASLLNIHGRSAGTPEARAAYAGISRRVGALSIVHRNHFAEMEENRGISLRPLLSELAAELRASAPESARGLTIDLELDSVYTTQDVAVAIAFLITEVIEHAMLHAPHDAVELSLRRTSELTARLTLASPTLVPDEEGRPEKMQFERIVAGLAKQLRSTLDRKLGRYSVDLPVFPPA